MRPAVSSAGIVRIAAWMEESWPCRQSGFTTIDATSFRKLCANFVQMRTQHDALGSDARVAGDFKQMLDESFPAIGKQRFRGAHAARFTGGKDRPRRAASDAPQRQAS